MGNQKIHRTALDRDVGITKELMDWRKILGLAKNKKRYNRRKNFMY